MDAKMFHAMVEVMADAEPSCISGEAWTRMDQFMDAEAQAHGHEGWAAAYISFGIEARERFVPHLDPSAVGVPGWPLPSPMVVDTETGRFAPFSEPEVVCKVARKLNQGLRDIGTYLWERVEDWGGDES